MAQEGLSQKARLQLILRGVLAPIAMFVLLFGLAGRWSYWQAWVFVGLTTLVLIVMSTLLSPGRELIEERLNPKQGVKTWDKLYMALSTPLYFIALIIAGLDARFRWTHDMPLWFYWSGAAAYLLGNAILLWARYTNHFFSSMVRIQADRGQTVCRAGPYRIVRHPGYVGGILMALAMGVVLGSWWACIPQALAALMLVWRTSLEDRTLHAELPGYQEFARETRYRLVPGVW
jgi:protein-S-isoprenylcysteine O-methyltransferase Ste14